VLFINIIRAIESRTGWKRHIARIRRMRKAYEILVRKPEKRRLFGRFYKDRWIILKLILNK
jgi:hypothetical protein